MTSFFTAANLAQILAGAAPLAVVATGMTFVLVTAGVDLSVGALIFFGGALAGLLAQDGVGPLTCAGVMIAVGAAGGAVNAGLVAGLRLPSFVATLGLLSIGRGLGRWATETRAINLPDAFLAVGATTWLGVPLPVWIAGAVVASGHLVLSRTPFGRQLYAIGADAAIAADAGVRVAWVRAGAYVACGACAGIGGVLALAQLGAVSPRLGEGYEFDAITAAVLGGTSLFGGRGRVLPGTIAGVVGLKVLFAALVAAGVDAYGFPVWTAAVIFVAVLVDSRRRVRQEAAVGRAARTGRAA